MIYLALRELGFEDEEFSVHGSQIRWNIPDPGITTTEIEAQYLTVARREAHKAVKQAAKNKRSEYVTDAPGKDAEYRAKQREAEQFAVDGSVGLWMQARMDLTGETSAQVAGEWAAKSVAWQQIGAAIAAIEDRASQEISGTVDWSQCEAIANTAISDIGSI